MEVLKEFVVCLVTTIIFITAIELVGPDNEMKKYLKFVLGLILVAVILNPVIDFLTKGEGYLSKAVDSYTNKISGEIEENSKDTSKQNNDMRKKNFKENFDKNCESALNKKFEDY
ncbi:MAG: stage III sporulation protein AF, partial [Clostridium sp.]|nr:stage III sporulation protein AF [Clostridium sp.]